jgi:hypothetical protein
MTLAIIVVGVLLAVVALVLAIGAALPVKHVACASATFLCSIDDAWRRLAAYAEYPRWRRGLRQVEQISADIWREIDSKGGGVTYESVEAVPPRRLVRRITDRNLPYGGSWTIELKPSGDQQVAITITENGEVYSPVFRFVSRFLMGHHASMSAFLEDFGRDGAWSTGQRTQIHKS